MTIAEAERILDLVSAALQDETHPGRHPVSALQGRHLRDHDRAQAAHCE